jgi:hypothetical protein
VDDEIRKLESHAGDVKRRRSNGEGETLEAEDAMINTKLADAMWSLDQIDARERELGADGEI